MSLFMILAAIIAHCTVSVFAWQLAIWRPYFVLYHPDEAYRLENIVLLSIPIFNMIFIPAFYYDYLDGKNLYLIEQQRILDTIYIISDE